MRAGVREGKRRRRGEVAEDDGGGGGGRGVSVRVGRWAYSMYGWVVKDDRTMQRGNRGREIGRGG